MLKRIKSFGSYAKQQQKAGEVQRESTGSTLLKIRSFK
jgi:hypothetical protein